MTDEVSPDGSPVAAYAALPAEPELGVVRALLIAQRLEPGRLWRTGSAQLGAVTIALDDLVVDGSRVEATTTYSVDGRSWRQPWVLWERDDAELNLLLSAAGLNLTSSDGMWLTATR